jgi:hypothetical protein
MEDIGYPFVDPDHRIGLMQKKLPSLLPARTAFVGFTTLDI